MTVDLYQELATYTGRDIDLVRQRCETALIELAWQWHEQNAKANPIEFYRKTDLYLFDLTRYQMELHDAGWYRWLQARVLDELKPKSVIDVGGGIGETLIQMTGPDKRDYLDVCGSPTMRYAEWRFRQRAYNIRIWDETPSLPIQKYDLIIAMDVLEHIANPELLIREFTDRSEYLICNCHHLPYGTYFPQHISEPNLEPYYRNIGGDLWRRK